MTLNITQEFVNLSFEKHWKHNDIDTFIEFPDDVKIIQQVILDKFGVTLSDVEANEFWQQRSFAWDAGWLSIKNEDISNCFEWFLRKIHGLTGGITPGY